MMFTLAATFSTGCQLLRTGMRRNFFNERVMNSLPDVPEANDRTAAPVYGSVSFYDRKWGLVRSVGCLTAVNCSWPPVKQVGSEDTEGEGGLVDFTVEK